MTTNNNQMSEQKIQNDLLILMHKKDYSYLPDTADKAQMEIDSDVARIERVTNYIITLISHERAKAVRGLANKLNETFDSLMKMADSGNIIGTHLVTQKVIREVAEEYLKSLQTTPTTEKEGK